MFGLFKKKSKVEILNSNYKKLQEEAYKLSTSSRAQSDQKYTEAEEVLKEIEAIQKAGTD
jgi:hypothetical protein